MSAHSRSIAMVVTLLLGVADLAVLDFYLAPQVLGEDADDPATDENGDTPVAVPIAPVTNGIPTPVTRTPPVLADASPPPPQTPPQTDAALDVPVVAAADADVPELPADASVDAAPPPPDASPAVAPPTDFEPTMVTLYFPPDRATIKPYHKDKMDEAVALLKAFPQAVAVIEGHADATEDRYGIVPLIRRRMRKVEKYLLAKGIAPDRIRSINRGSSAGADEAAASENRWARLRVELP